MWGHEDLPSQGAMAEWIVEGPPVNPTFCRTSRPQVFLNCVTGTWNLIPFSFSRSLVQR